MKGCINYVVALMVETMAKQEFSTAKCYRVDTSTWEYLTLQMEQLYTT